MSVEFGAMYIVVVSDTVAASSMLEMVVQGCHLIAGMTIEEL
jgi:hypothetical protein